MDFNLHPLTFVRNNVHNCTSETLNAVEATFCDGITRLAFNFSYFAK